MASYCVGLLRRGLRKFTRSELKSGNLRHSTGQWRGQVFTCQAFSDFLSCIMWTRHSYCRLALPVINTFFQSIWWWGWGWGWGSSSILHQRTKFIDRFFLPRKELVHLINLFRKLGWLSLLQHIVCLKHI